MSLKNIIFQNFQGICIEFSNSQAQQLNINEVGEPLFLQPCLNFKVIANTSKEEHDFLDVVVQINFPSQYLVKVLMVKVNCPSQCLVKVMTWFL